MWRFPTRTISPASRRAGRRRAALGRALIAGLIAVGFGGTTAHQTATAADRVDKQHESAIRATCRGSLPDGRRVMVDLAHVDSTAGGRYDDVFVTLRDAGGSVLGQGDEWWSPESVWVNGRLDVTVDVLRDWVEPLGQVQISFDYATGGARAVTSTIRNGNHMYVVRQSIADVTFASPSLALDGVQVVDPTCSGQAFDTSWINTYPSREIYGYGALVNAECTSTNIRNDYLLIKSSEGLQFYVAFEQPDGLSALAAPFRLNRDTWSGQVPVSGPEGPAGTVDATYTLTSTGPTTHLTTEFPEYGYTERKDVTPAEVHLVLSGSGLSAELSCTLEIWDVVQKWG